MRFLSYGIAFTSTSQFGFILGWERMQIAWQLSTTSMTEELPQTMKRKTEINVKSAARRG